MVYVTANQRVCAKPTTGITHSTLV